MTGAIFALFVLPALIIGAAVLMYRLSRESGERSEP